MAAVRRRTPQRLAVGAALALALAGCGGGGASSPEDAVADFLDPWAKPPRGNVGPAGRKTRAFYRRLCRDVDPDIRRGLRVDDQEKYSELTCGAVVSLLVAYTGDTNEMEPPTSLSGEPLSAGGEGDASVVTVDMRYAARSSSAPAPPANARVKVLAVRRDGDWYVATPEAFNPLHARDGGFSEAELRAQHREYLDEAEG